MGGGIGANGSGDLTYLNAAGQPVVIINSRKVAVELLERRSGIYSDRPHNVVVDIMSHGSSLPLPRMMICKPWRFSKSAVKGFYETQNTEAVILASDLLAHPAQWDRHYRRAPASTTLSLLYGNPTLKSKKIHRQGH
ncbi:hypothetical protein BJV77DRAFT_1039925 [Russula vinacea]|nr:hypothetical protein BJV77DRAFT_1039925 [Russula vinacea]